MALTEVDVARLNDDVFAATGTNKNRIINGDMRIDQRNAGASVTPGAATFNYYLDRWGFGSSQASKVSVQQNAGGVTPPAGFTHYLGVTSLSAYSVVASDYFWLYQKIEGFNTADLDWGKVSTKTITLSFWVQSSLTGTFSGSLQNSGINRTYPFSYVINSSNTWEYKTISIPGDTLGTWLTNNSTGIQVNLSVAAGSNNLGTAGAWVGTSYIGATGSTSLVGTNGATFYVTGVQLEAGDTATPFERRNYGQELALCQRYFQRWQLGPRDTRFIFERDADSSSFIGTCELNVLMRTFPHTATFRDAANWNVHAGAAYTVDSRSLHASAGSGTLTNVNRVGITITSTALANQLGGNWQTIQIRSNSNTLMPSVLFDAEM